jgi:hypothetical protein
MVAASNGNFNVVNDPVYKQCIAAALRAAADQVKHAFPLCSPVTEWDSGHDAGIRRALNKFLALAAELDKTSQQS